MQTLSPQHSLYTELVQYFSSYAATFDARDWDSFIAHYHQPAMSIRADGTVVLLHNHQQASSFFQSVAEKWRQEGYTHFTTRDFEVCTLGRYSAIVTFTWEMRSADNSIIRHWRQSYQVNSRDNIWYVCLSTFHGV